MADPDGAWLSLTEHLRRLPDAMPRPPTAIVVVTAHWEAPEFTVASGSSPDLIFDYYGFPPHTYDLEYPAPGSPEIASKVADLATAAGFPTVTDPKHGWDHGVFVPVAVSWPNADVPIVAVSLRAGLDPTEHIGFGRALAPLRDENVAIIGSGLSIHDLSFRITPDEASQFDRWLEDVMGRHRAERDAALSRWADAPRAREAHPREEHLLPLMVVAGAGNDGPAERIYDDTMFGLPAATYLFA